MLEILRRPTPCVLSCTLRWVEGHRECWADSGKLDASGIPHKRARCAESDISRVRHPEVPSPCLLLPGSAGGACAFRRCTDHYRCIAGARGIEASSLVRRQHRPWINQYPAPCDEQVRRHGNVVIEVAVLQIELLTEIRKRIPATQVVVNGHAWIPLCDVVDLAVLSIDPGGATAEFPRYGVVITDVDSNSSAKARKRLRQPNLHARVRDRVVRLLCLAVIVNRECIDNQPVGEFAVPRVIGRYGPGIRPIRVLIELQP